MPDEDRRSENQRVGHCLRPGVFDLLGINCNNHLAGGRRDGQEAFSDADDLDGNLRDRLGFLRADVGFGLGRRCHLGQPNGGRFLFRASHRAKPKKCQQQHAAQERAHSTCHHYPPMVSNDMSPITVCNI